jgi:hypothetical protein
MEWHGVVWPRDKVIGGVSVRMRCKEDLAHMLNTLLGRLQRLLSKR